MSYKERKFLTSISIIAGILILSYGVVSLSYAERSVVEVPFDYHGHGCSFNEDIVTYTCTWQGSSETITKKGLQDAGVVPPEQIAEESKEAHETAIEIRDEVETKKTQAEIILERLAEKIDRGSATDADRELYRVLKEVETKCYFGIEEGRLIQKFQELDLPDTTVDTNPRNNMDYKNQLGKIAKLLEACEAWDVYKVEQLGAEYINKIDDDSTTQGHHSDAAEGIEPYNTHELTPEDYANAEQKAQDAICGHSFYSKEFKQNAGCFPNPVIVEGAGIDLYKDGPLKAYKQYMESGGWVDLATLKQEQIEIALQKTADSFAQEQGIDPADLKNWLAEQREKHGGQK